LDPVVPQEWSGVEEAADDQVHADHPAVRSSATTIAFGISSTTPET